MRALKVREIKYKVMCAFTSYAWTPQLALRRMREYAEEMGIPLAATAEMKHDNFESVRAALDEMVEKSLE
jgi:hypothetical protein